MAGKGGGIAKDEKNMAFILQKPYIARTSYQAHKSQAAGAER